MPMNVAGFIDVGYVRAAVARACGIEPSRVRLDAAALVRMVEDVAEKWSGLMLRAYWYDGQHPADDPRHAPQRKYLDAVASNPGIQLRLGHIVSRTPAWHAQLDKALTACNVDRARFDRLFPLAQQKESQQKGVDALIVLDLVRLAQRRAYDIAVIFSGDRDIAEAVRAAQDEGRRVTLMMLDERSVAPELRSLADSVIAVSTETLQSLNRTQVRPDPTPRPAAAATSDPAPAAPTQAAPAQAAAVEEPPVAAVPGLAELPTRAVHFAEPAPDPKPAEGTPTPPTAPASTHTPPPASPAGGVTAEEPAATQVPPTQQATTASPAPAAAVSPAPPPAKPAVTAPPAFAVTAPATPAAQAPQVDVNDLFGDEAPEPGLAADLFGSDDEPTATAASVNLASDLFD